MPALPPGSVSLTARSGSMASIRRRTVRSAGPSSGNSAALSVKAPSGSASFGHFTFWTFSAVSLSP